MYFSSAALEQYLEDADVVIFDMNGLIIDDEPIQLNATNSALNKAGYKIEISEETWIKLCVGRKPAEWISEILRQNDLPTTGIEQIVSYKDKIYSKLIGSDARSLIREGVLELIQHLKLSPLKRLALATSTTRHGMELILGPSNLDIISSFDLIICGDQVQKSKPHPEIYLKVKDHFGQGLQYLVFEDAAPGVEAAVNAGMHCVAVPNKFTMLQDFSKALMIADSLASSARPINMARDASMPGTT